MINSAALSATASVLTDLHNQPALTLPETTSLLNMGSNVPLTELQAGAADGLESAFDLLRTSSSETAVQQDNTFIGKTYDLPINNMHDSHSKQAVYMLPEGSRGVETRTGQPDIVSKMFPVFCELKHIKVQLSQGVLQCIKRVAAVLHVHGGIYQRSFAFCPGGDGDCDYIIQGAAPLPDALHAAPRARSRSATEPAPLKRATITIMKVHRGTLGVLWHAVHNWGMQENGFFDGKDAGAPCECLQALGLCWSS